MANREHGTRAKYVHDRCRCLLCRAANSRYVSLVYARTAPPVRIHCVGGGQYWIITNRRTGAVLWKSPRRGRRHKATMLTLAQAEKRRLARELRDDLRDPHWANNFVLKTVRDHVEALRVRGVSLRRVAALTGMSRSRLREIEHNRGRCRNRPFKRRVKYVTAQRILGVRLNASPARGAIIPGAHTWALIDQLLARGYTKAWIAKQIGAKSPALQLRREHVLRSSADKIAAIAAFSGFGFEQRAVAEALS